MPKPRISAEEQKAYDKALVRIEACRRQRRTTLILSGLGLTRLPPEIGQLTRLKELALGSNQLTTLPPEIGRLTALTRLSLNANQLTTLPPEIGQFKALRDLRLHNNQLTALPPEIGQLTALRELDVDNNQLTALPPEIGQLTALRELDVDNNQLTALPPEIGQLTALTGLSFYNNQLVTLPPEIGQLTALTELALDANQLTTLPQELGQLVALTELRLDNNRLTTLLPEIGRLTALTRLYLFNNQLTTLPMEIGRLKALTRIDLHYNKLNTLPSEFSQLVNLTELHLYNNQLSTVPPAIFQLTNLTGLYLSGNGLGILPPEIGRLTKLTRLRFGYNQVSELPSEIGLLVNLTMLRFGSNEVSALPPEICQLANLTELSVAGNPLQDPPPSVVSQGIKAIRRYFADKAKSGTELLWRSKLMLVGQGRVGKTELRHRLLGRPFGQAKSTEVVEIETVPVPHPQQAGVTMALRCWDFGGQDIYHATHQFFLTGRSLFVFCFEAGKDWDAGKPYYWLDKIAAVAPDAPVIIVATKCDERPAPALPWDDLKKRYPQLVGEGCFTITTSAENRIGQAGDGIVELINCLQAVAADRKKLPLMGEELPKAWVQGMDAVIKHPQDHYLKRAAFNQLLTDAKVPPESQHTVAMMLRDLGEILYYCDDGDAALHEWVIIKPTWVTHAAARVLESAEVERKNGILTQAEMSKTWTSYPEPMHPVLLDLLEKYALTYKIPEDTSERSFVVEKLPKAEVEAPPEWAALKPAPGGANREMEMTFHLGSMQAGIPTWFIARKHYYTLQRHWLYGVYFADNRKAVRHVALVRASTDPKNPVVNLTVRGPFPQTFFAVLKEGLETSIRDRYPKLIQSQTIPCCCQDKKPGAAPCTHAFNYERLLQRLGKKPTAECDVTQEDVSVAELLFGYDAPVESTLKKLDEMEKRIIDEVAMVGDKMDDMVALVRQGFQLLYNDLQLREESHCPNYFVIWKAEKGKPFHVPLRLALVCQHPGEEHTACRAADAYNIDAMNEHLRKAAPLLKSVGKVLKYAKLSGLSVLKEWDKELGEAVGEFQDGLNEMLEDFEKIATKGEAPELLARDIDGGSGQLQEKRVAGAALREFRALLDKVDPQHKWQGLTKKRSNQSGEYLWVCEEHAAHKNYQR